MAEQHGKTLVPQIRFAGFTDPWEQRKLGELGFAQSGIGFPDAEQGGSEGIPFFKVSDMNTPGNERELVISNNYVTADQIARMSWHPICQVPAIFFAKVGAAVLLNRKRLVNEPFLLDNNTMAFSMDPNRLDSQFGQSLFERIDLTSLVQVGALPSYNASDVEDMAVSLPDHMDEQRRIGAFFDHLDSLITLHQRKYDKLCVLKKSMLDKMFPKGGSLYPEIRFAGFTDPWEQRKLGEVASGFEYGLNAAASDFDGEKKYLRITDIDDQTREFRTDDLSSPDINNPIDDRYLLKEGDILFARTGASVGKTYLYKASDGKTYYAGFLIRAHVSDEADAGFIFQSTLTERYKQFVLLTSQRSGQPGINAQEYSDLLLPLPSLMEQRRIGAFFDRLDSLITLHQRKLELLRNIKKSMLDKMFV
ncbi:restriction endonuclease subunit S [Bifidobacterium adolescentis]|uniref:restriction endonuclease subunit S n=2 Tax=Bifidobacterium adolescentis TaxID=1680 RepID=UPI00189B2C1C|nr:restriction endonuclease subunit S [Bifidobacterium adolescentis]